MELTIGEGLTQDATVARIWNYINNSEDFTKIFYFMGSINQLQIMGYIDKYVSLPIGANKIFYKLVDSKLIHLEEKDLDQILDLSEKWDLSTKKKIKKFYKAYHTYKWADLGKNLLIRTEEDVEKVRQD